MKKALIITLIIVVVAVIGACNESNKSYNNIQDRPSYYKLQDTSTKRINDTTKNSSNTNKSSRSSHSYSNKSGGNTLCCDGTFSSASGRGACSGHGGVMGGRTCSGRNQGRTSGKKRKH